MDDVQKQITEGLRAEALALFSVNQAGRSAAERVGALTITLVGVAVAAGINAGTDVVLLPLAPICLLLLSWMFQQYVEVSVTGAARALLEQKLSEQLGQLTLSYEHAVAPVRKEPPLVYGVRVLQALTMLLVAGVTLSATIVAFQGQRWYVLVGFLVGTSLALISALVSYRDMLRSGRVAALSIGARLQGDANDPGG